MTDSKKVLNDLQELCEYLFNQYKYCCKGDEEDTYNRFLAANNALNLLKEQSEADEVAPTIGEGTEGEEVIRCGSCGTSLYHLFPWTKINKARAFVQYCRHCGRGGEVGMNDNNYEKVLKGLECCSKSISTACPMECPYRIECLMQDDGLQMYSVMKDAVKLLKEQEAVEPEVEILNEIDRIYRCPKCHKAFFYKNQKYCDCCGQKVKWDD